MKKFTFLVVALLYLGIAQAQYTDILNFDGTNGEYPYLGSLTLSGKVLYGLTESGGANGDGCIFSLDTNGKGYKDLLDFNGSTTGPLGARPQGSLVRYKAVLYGMTEYGGSHDSGCVFSIDTNGNDYKDLFNFTKAKGTFPNGSLTIAGNKLYGMTEAGGANNAGIIFSIDTNGGSFKDMLDFAGFSNGKLPFGSLTLYGNTLYGMTGYGGANFDGNIFSIDTNGNNFKDLLDFNGSNSPEGQFPYGSLTLSGNKLFGMTYKGGLHDSGCMFSVDTNGNGYKDLLDFNYTSASYPFGSLTFVGSTLYGMASGGGTGKAGCLFSIDSNGSGYTNLVNFDNAMGDIPYGSLTHADGVFYGMTEFGGTNGYGVVFSFRDTSYIITSVSQLSVSSNQLSLYPNPNKGIFTIQSSVNSGQSSVLEVYNVLGEQVLTETLRSTQGDNLITLTGQASGIYFYRVLQQGGGLIGEGKLIIE